MGVMLSAAGSLRWYRDVVAPEVEFADLVAEAKDVGPGSDGLLFLPYLTGERTPHADPLARGAFVGLGAGHGRAALTRAVLEGVAFGLRDSLELMSAIGMAPPSEVRATGGGSRSVVWRQILADVLEASVVTTPSAEGAASGAAMLAAVAAGWFPTVDAVCEAFVVLGDRVDPSPDLAPYRSQYERYRALYPALAPTFHGGGP